MTVWEIDRAGFAGGGWHARLNPPGAPSAWVGGPYPTRAEAQRAGDWEWSRRRGGPAPGPLAEIRRLDAIERAARAFLWAVGPGLRDLTPEGRLLLAALGSGPVVHGREPTEDEVDRGDETCARADMNPVDEAQRAFGGLVNTRDRMRVAAAACIRDHDREWARLECTGGLDERTWRAAVDLRDSYVADLIRAIGDAL